MELIRSFDENEDRLPLWDTGSQWLNSYFKLRGKNWRLTVYYTQDDYSRWDQRYEASAIYNPEYSASFLAFYDFSNMPQLARWRTDND